MICEKEYEQLLYNVDSLQSCLFVIDEFHLMRFPLHLQHTCSTYFEIVLYNPYK